MCTMNHSVSVLVFQQMGKMVLRWKEENDDTKTRGQAAGRYKHVFPPSVSLYPGYPTDVIFKAWILAQLPCVFPDLAYSAVRL